MTTMLADRLYPVVDGDDGADIYGEAYTLAGAMALAGERFADPVVDGYFEAGPILMSDGTTIEGGAWVALTFIRNPLVTIRVSPYITWQGPASRAAEAGRF